MNNLNDDILYKIFEIRINDLESDLEFINLVINKLGNILRPLTIKKVNDIDYSIKYDITNFYSKSFLYDIPIKNNVIVIYPGYIYDNNPNYVSNLLVNPTFFTLLLEANKAVKMEKIETLNNIITFEGISVFNKFKCQLFNIKYDSNIKYIELKFGIYNNID